MLRIEDQFASRIGFFIVISTFRWIPWLILPHTSPSPRKRLLYMLRGVLFGSTAPVLHIVSRRTGTSSDEWQWHCNASCKCLISDTVSESLVLLVRLLSQHNMYFNSVVWKFFSWPTPTVVATSLSYLSPASSNSTATLPTQFFSFVSSDSLVWN